MKVGYRWYTTREAIERFLAARVAKEPSSTTAATIGAQRSVRKELEALGVRTLKLKRR